MDLALPGTLPVMNREAVACAIKLGLALGSHIAPVSILRARITSTPTCPRATRSASSRSRWCRAARCRSSWATKEDRAPGACPPRRRRGKSLHEDFIGQSGIDLNRAGTPLLEIVTEPDIQQRRGRGLCQGTAQDRDWIGICDGNMQEGSFRCDANVSVRKPGAPLGTAARSRT